MRIERYCEAEPDLDAVLPEFRTAARNAAENQGGTLGDLAIEKRFCNDGKWHTVCTFEVDHHEHA